MSEAAEPAEAPGKPRKKKRKRAPYRSAPVGVAAIRDELERIGFRIVSSSDESVVAVRQKWHWDAVITKMTYVVFVQAVGKLEESDLDPDEFQRRGKDIDPSVLPRGFQKGTVVMPVFLARDVADGVLERVRSTPPMRFAFFFFPVIRDESSGEGAYCEKTPLWGGLYYAKFRWLASRILHPGQRGGEPLSVAGLILTVLIFALLGVQIARFL
jgi:hypothetical protein